MKISIGFSGDIAFSEYTKDIYKTPKNIDKEIYDFFEGNDYNILNFESPVTESNLTKKAALMHKSNPKTLDYIKNNIKNPILSLANNHMMDFGPKGLLDTLKNMKNSKLPFIGAGINEDKATDYMIIGKDIKVGVIAAQYKDYYIAGLDTPGPAHNKHFDIIKKKIKDLKTKTDWVVMVYHGGEEFINAPLPYTRNLYKKFLSWGVDVVVAHHPHTVQGWEKFKDKYIFYSLGNFIFDTDFQRAQSRTDEGMLIKLIFTKDNIEFDSLSLKRDRDENKINVVSSNNNFQNIKGLYRKLWKKEARKLVSIKEQKKELKRNRNMYSIKNLYIEKANIENIVSFDELIKNNFIEELNVKPDIKTTSFFERVIRKLNRLKKANYKKHLCIKIAQIFK